MIRLLLITSVFLQIFISSQAQSPGQIPLSVIPQPAWHYQEEYTFDTIIDPGKWNSVKPGLHASFATTNELFFRREVPGMANSQSLEATVWKGERLNAQLLLWSQDTLDQVRIIAHDLQSSDGKKISRKDWRVNMVRYVVSNYPYGAKNVTCGESPYKDLYLMPDRFDPVERFDIPGRTARPLWLTLDIPRDISPGTFEGNIKIISGDSRQSLHVKIRVQDQLLPEPKEWKHRLDLWQNPWVIARYNNLEPWSEAHKVLLKKHLKMQSIPHGQIIHTG